MIRISMFNSLGARLKTLVLWLRAQLGSAGFENCFVLTLLPSYYSNLFQLTRQYGFRRIPAMNSASTKNTQDLWSPNLYLLTLAVRIFSPGAYKTIQSNTRVFEEGSIGLDWTVFCLAGLPGKHDEGSWKKDREDALVFGKSDSTKRGERHVEVALSNNAHSLNIIKRLYQSMISIFGEAIKR